MKKNVPRPISNRRNSTNVKRKIVLVTGGSRSGKSNFALELAQKEPGRRVYVATCPAIDKELEERIARHRASRSGRGWDTIEELLDLKKALERAFEYPFIVVDCLTLWINNLLWDERQSGTTIDEDGVSRICKELEETLSSYKGTIVFVTNEVGMGLVPGDPLSRRYRDLAGRCNQEIASFADDVVLMTAGIPMYVKKGNR